ASAMADASMSGPDTALCSPSPALFMILTCEPPMSTASTIRSLSVMDASFTVRIWRDHDADLEVDVFPLLFVQPQECKYHRSSNLKQRRVEIGHMGAEGGPTRLLVRHLAPAVGAPMHHRARPQFQPQDLAVWDDG